MMERMYGEGPYGEGPYGYADPEMLDFAVDSLQQRNTELDRKLRVYLQALSFQAQGHVLKEAITPYEALADVAVEVNRLPPIDPTVIGKSHYGVVSFFIILMSELRTVICGKGKNPKKLGTNSQAVLTALAAAITRKIGITDPTAMGIAVLMLITLGAATKKAFCKMSDIDALNAVKGLSDK